MAFATSAGRRRSPAALHDLRLRRRRQGTLIGRLLYDTKLIFEDQLAALERDTGSTARWRRHRSRAAGRRPARRSASRASPSTSPTATSRPRGASSSSPTRRATSSTRATWRPARRPPTWRSSWSTRARACCAQTRRHSAIIASLLGIRHVVLAVNKMDLVGFDRRRFERDRRGLRGDGRAARLRLGHGHPAVGAARRQCHPARAARCRGIAGPTLLEHLETVDVARAARTRPFRLPVQWVNRPTRDFRGYAGTVAGRQRPAGRRGRRRCRRACARTSSASSPPTAISTAPSRARPSP